MMNLADGSGSAAADGGRAGRGERDRNMFPFLDESNPIM